MLSPNTISLRWGLLYGSPPIVGESHPLFWVTSTNAIKSTGGLWKWWSSLDSEARDQHESLLVRLTSKSWPWPRAVHKRWDLKSLEAYVGNSPWSLVLSHAVNEWMNKCQGVVIATIIQPFLTRRWALMNHHEPWVGHHHWIFHSSATMTWTIK